MIEYFRQITKEGDVAYMETRMEMYGSNENIEFFYRGDQSRDEVFRVINNIYSGLAWSYQGKDIILLDNTFCRVEGFPSLDLKYVIAKYVESEKYPKPTNMVIYNADGTIHKEGIIPPPLLNYPKSKGDFLQFLWKVDLDDGIYKNCMMLNLSGGPELEFREFDPATGEFGKVLKGSSRL